MKALIQYVNPQGPLPPVVGTKSGSLLVIGSASCVSEDLARYDEVHEGDRMLVNGMIRYYGGHPVQHLVSLHPALMWKWTAWRDDAGWLTHSNSRAAGFPREHLWPLKRDGGTSGLFAVFIGLLMGYSSITLAGMPCDASSHCYDSTPNPLVGSDANAQEWRRAIDAGLLTGVRSLSGRSAQWLGSPLL